jgi:23S rRNA pseudouridine2605 synthase
MPPRRKLSSGPRRPGQARPAEKAAERPQKSRPDRGPRRGGKNVSVPEARGSRPVVPPTSKDANEAGSEVADSVSGMRLQKFLAMAGVDSRRNCEEYIRTGRVTVDGEVVTDPARSVDPTAQDIRLDSEKLRPPRFRYFLLNKPKGFLCTNSDPQGRPRAVDLIPVKDQRLFTVGRLDESTEGMLLVTNDGDLAQKLAHPRFEVIRKYRCHVAGVPEPETLTQLREGMYFADGYFRFRNARVLKRRGRSAVLELELQEGKNREIRRLMARVGHKVIALERVAFGPLSLGSLHPGEFRELHSAEVQNLRHFAEHGETAGSRAPQNRSEKFGYRPGQTRGSRRRPEKPAVEEVPVSGERRKKTPENTRWNQAESGPKASEPQKRVVKRGDSQNRFVPTGKAEERPRPTKKAVRKSGSAGKVVGPKKASRPAKRVAKGQSVRGETASRQKGRDRRQQR